MRRAFKVIFGFVIVPLMFLALLYPWCSLSLQLPASRLGHLNFSNRPGYWFLRIGDIGGDQGFECSWEAPPAQLVEIRQKLVPFSLITDWGFAAQRQSPFLLVQVPLHLPSLLVAYCLYRQIKRRLRVTVHASSKPKMTTPTAINPPRVVTDFSSRYVSSAVIRRMDRRNEDVDPGFVGAGQSVTSL